MSGQDNRLDTDLILESYYYLDSDDVLVQSSSSNVTTTSLPPAPRRTSIPSQGGADRRRLAIVETNPPNIIPPSDSGGSSPTLALVAPPDASPLNYSQPCGQFTAEFPKVGFSHVPRKSSREIAIIGTTTFPESSHQPLNPIPAPSLRPPLFQVPQSRSPSPGTSDISDCRGRQRKDALAPGLSPIRQVKETSTPIRTPNIGESKHISDPVAGPVVINLFSQSPSSSPVFSSPPSSPQDIMSPRTNTSSPLTPSTALTSPTASPYLYYQPGLHATAGPLPPPPKAVFNTDPKLPPPPRPPRHLPVRKTDDLETMKQALQLPPHVNAVLRAKSSSSSTEKEAVSTSPHKSTTAMVPPVVPPTGSPQRCAVLSRHRPRLREKFRASSHESLGSDYRPHHVREGAFSPSRICTLDSESSHADFATSLPRLDSMDDLVASIGLAIDDMGIINSSDVPPPSVVEPPRGHEGNGRKGLEIRRSDNPRLGLNCSPSAERHHVNSSSSSRRSDESVAQSRVDPDRTITRSVEPVPPVPAKNDLPHLDTKSFRNALNIKRFSSLPRTPSLMSLNRPSLRSKRSSGTPSHSITHSVLQRKPFRMTKLAHPPAMSFADVTVKRTSLERSIGYAYKINELYNCHCGLGDWIAETRYKALHPHSSTKRFAVNSSRGARAPSTSSPSITPRHISHSSTDSGVTFPIRPDACSATDLASRTAGDASPPNAPPPLPYPALVASPRSGPSRASTIIATSSTSSSRSAVSPSAAKSPGGFFASLGRKASIKKEKLLTPSSPPKKLSRSPSRNGNNQPTPHPVHLPTIPGGPRAPPNRMKRSQTIIVTPNSTNGESPQRSTSIARIPSHFDGRNSTSAHLHNTPISGTMFNRQVDKLAALLPKADRNVLAVYLQRTGHDVLAIGQYLEDEKNGTFRYERY